MFLIREVSQFEPMHALIIKNLENLSSLGYIDHFKHSHSLRETLFKSLVQILRNLGKKKFRGYVEVFLDPAFRNAKNQDNLNMALAAQDFILEMEKTYGAGIFKAILEAHDDRYIADLDRFRAEGAAMKPKDFVYPPRQGVQPIPPEMVMTKAPWAK